MIMDLGLRCSRESCRSSAVESHICQNRADMGHPSFVTGREKSGFTFWLVTQPLGFVVGVDVLMGGGDYLLCAICWNHLVASHLHVETAHSLGEGGERGAVGEHLGHRDFGPDHCRAPAAAHPLNAAPPSGQVSHQNTGTTLRRLTFHPHQ